MFVVEALPLVRFVFTTAQVDGYGLRIRPYTCHIRSVYDRIFPVYGHLRPCFGKLRYIDRRFFVVSYHPVHYHRIYP
jgi:hypothetical protein